MHANRAQHSSGCRCSHIIFERTGQCTVTSKAHLTLENGVQAIETQRSDDPMGCVFLHRLFRIGVEHCHQIEAAALLIQTPQGNAFSRCCCSLRVSYLVLGGNSLHVSYFPAQRRSATCARRHIAQHLLCLSLTWVISIAVTWQQSFEVDDDDLDEDPGDLASQPLIELLKKETKHRRRLRKTIKLIRVAKTGIMLVVAESLPQGVLQVHFLLSLFCHRQHAPASHRQIVDCAHGCVCVVTACEGESQQFKPVSH